MINFNTDNEFNGLFECFDAASDAIDNECADQLSLSDSGTSTMFSNRYLLI
jgi:hypothetical protein